MGKGGGSVDIPQREPGMEWANIKKYFGGAENQYEQGLPKKDPLLKMLYGGAEDYYKSPTSPLLSELQSQGLSQLQGGQNPLLKNLNERAMAPDSLLTNLTNTVNQPDYLSGKVSAQELSNVVDQPTLAKFASMGNVGGNQAALQNFLNRDQYTQARQAQHLGEAGNVEQLRNQFNQFGLGVEGLNTQDLANRFGIAQGVNQASQQDIAQRFSIPQSVFQTGIGGHTALTNPILGWLSDLFSSNQNAAAAQSVAGANQKSGQTSGILSTIGSVAMAAATAY